MKVMKHKDYYYLAHSFRADGKVVHREKYLGKEIPKNLEEIRKEFLRECMQGTFKKLNAIRKNFRIEWKKYPGSVKKEILIDLSVSFTYNTNAIEGSTITLHETEDIIKRKISPNKPLRDVQETINHSKTFFKAINEKYELSADMLLKWHKEIFSDTKQDIAGRFRDYLVRVGSYRAPDWQEVNKLMKEFFEWLSKSKKTVHAVELAARAHYKFEKIHPFGDGNGRIGRLIIAYLLRKGNYPLLIIEHKKRKSYYHALSKSENDFVNWLIRKYISAHRKYLGKN
ncbi:Fic family protein [Candidatus Woesearchaeota archaeon]|nr:Fic family protein [Candidatus Woesearchaeota archaeon]